MLYGLTLRKSLYLFSVLNLFVSCASIDVHGYYHGVKGKIKNIGLGDIQLRNVELPSSVQENFYSTLSFTLEKSDYHVLRLLTDNATEKERNHNFLKPEEIFQLTKTNPFDIFLQGYIYESKSGDILDETIETSVTLWIYDRIDGKKIGEIRAFGKTGSLVSEAVQYRIAEEIVAKLSKLTSR